MSLRTPVLTYVYNRYKAASTTQHGDDSDGIEKYLTPEEFAKLRKAVMDSDRLEKVHDLFIFQLCLL